MSDSDGNIDDELLELAGATEKKRKRQATLGSPGVKRRKSNVSDTEDDAEGEEEVGKEINLYPLEGRYEDESDRARLLAMSEIEREAILAERLEQMQKIQDRRKLQEMIRQQKGISSDPDTVSKAAKRQHTVRGATKEKSKKLDELKAKRKAKYEKKRARTDSPKRDHSSSPMDMDTSSGEEDGQITKHDEEEERDRKLYSKKPDPDDEPVSLGDLVACKLTRDMLAKYCMAPWFEDVVKGGWVRYLIGQENGEPVYRLCEVLNLGAVLVKPYPINDQMVDRTLELKHGKSAKVFTMDKVSNSDFDSREFDRLTKVCLFDDVKLPSKRQLEKKAAQLEKLVKQPLTESDIAAMIARKNQLNQHPSTTSVTMERSRLMQAKTLAMRRHDYAELEEIEGKLKELPAQVVREEEETLSGKLARVNERNRRANLEAVRRAEFEAERKRKERKLAVSGLSGVSTPDPSGKLKVPKLPDNTSRSATPNLSTAGTLVLQAQSIVATRSVSPLPSSVPTAVQSSPRRSLEASLLDTIEIDLGDF